MKINHKNYLNLAFEAAKINLGKTSENPSVGCVVVKNESVILSTFTSVGGRPHAEFNAFKNKNKINNANIYLTMEPCTHYGKTPPCTNILNKKRIRNLYYVFNDVDKRTSNKSKDILQKKGIFVKKFKLNNYKDFYESYISFKNKNIPLIDAKLAISKDYYTINKKNKWITNSESRRRAHLIRSQYDCILSTSRSINLDNSLLNCRIESFNANKPDLVIVDLNLKIKKNLNLFKNKKRQIIIITSISKNKKINHLKNKGVKFVFIKSLKNTKDLEYMFSILKSFNYQRILIETGLKFLNFLLLKRFIFNLFIFKSGQKIGVNGYNNSYLNLIKKIKLRNKVRIKVNLSGDSLYKIKLNHV